MRFDVPFEQLIENHNRNVEQVAKFNGEFQRVSEALAVAERRLAEAQSDLIRCEAAIRALVPSYRNPSDNCWCPHYVDPTRGHTTGCLLAGAALAPLGRASKPSGRG